jgi:outer membrane protein OmpA-like peptidoglycan-associated protein
MLVRLLVLLLALLAVTGCPKRPGMQAQAPAPSPGPSPAPAPFTDRELADELSRQGLGRPAPGAPTTPGDELPTEIRETPRGVVITFRHVLFSFDSADLAPRARLEIERMATVLNHPRAASRRVVLEGHADSIGTQAYNLDLSRRRAETVAQELAARGIRRARLSVEAFGKQRPIAPNTHPDGRDNPAGRALNRRVEAVVERDDGAPR